MSQIDKHTLLLQRVNEFSEFSIGEELVDVTFEHLVNFYVVLLPSFLLQNLHIIRHLEAYECLETLLE